MPAALAGEAPMPVGHGPRRREKPREPARFPRGRHGGPDQRDAAQRSGLRALRAALPDLSVQPASYRPERRSNASAESGSAPDNRQVLSHKKLYDADLDAEVDDGDHRTRLNPDYNGIAWPRRSAAAATHGHFRSHLPTDGILIGMNAESPTARAWLRRPRRRVQH